MSTTLFKAMLLLNFSKIHINTESYANSEYYPSQPYTPLKHPRAHAALGEHLAASISCPPLVFNPTEIALNT
jgi:hypothetical protein